MNFELRTRRKRYENDCLPSWMPMCIQAKIDFMRRSHASDGSLTQVIEELKKKARARVCGTCFCSSARLGLRMRSTRRFARSWDAVSSAPKFSIVRLPTRATWRCWRVMGPPSRRSNGSIRCWKARSDRASP